jgi:hypothetical protein
MAIDYNVKQVKIDGDNIRVYFEFHTPRIFSETSRVFPINTSMLDIMTWANEKANKLEEKEKLMAQYIESAKKILIKGQE